MHNDYTLAPDKTEVKRKIMSEYQLKIADQYNIPILNIKKMVPNFFDKNKYVIHCEKLKLYVRLGFKLKQIHRVLEVNQFQWLAKTIS